MSLAKVIEVMCEGPTIEEAIENSIAQASKTVEGIRQIYFKDIQGIVEDNEVVKYRINAKITFVVNEK